MEKNYEITEKQLAFLEDYIKRKKRYSNPEDLHELVDHLISDFEATTKTGNLTQYLADNSSFIYNYKGLGKNKESAIHWSYQRQLWQTFFSFFYKVKMLPYTFLIVFTFYIIFLDFNLPNKVLGYIFLILLIAVMIPAFVLTYHKKKKIRKLVSFKYLANVMALPNMFLYALSFLIDYLKEHRFIWLVYSILAIGLHIAGIILIREKRKIILEKYKHLLN